MLPKDNTKLRSGRYDILEFSLYLLCEQVLLVIKEVRILAFSAFTQKTTGW